MNNIARKLIEERNLDKIAKALEIAVEALEVIREHATYHDGAIGRIAGNTLQKIQAIAEGKGDD